MPGRMDLGSAEYDLIVNEDSLLSAFTKSEAKAKQATAAIGSAVRAQQKVIESAGTVMEATYGKVAAAQERAAQRAVQSSAVASKAFQDQLNAAKRAQSQQGGGGGLFDPGGGGGGGLKNIGQLAVVAAGGGLIGGGAVQAAHAFNQAITSTIDAVVKADQVSRNLNVTFGQTSILYRNAADAAAKYAGVSTRAAQEVTAGFGSLNKNYGFTSKQISDLTRLTLDYAAATGKDAVDVGHRLEAALRGEAESAEALGLTLNSDAVKAMAAMTAEQRKNFETLDQVTKAQIIYTELQRQSANVIGEAAKNNQSLSGATTQLAGSWEELVVAFGKAGESEFAAIARGAKLTVDAIRELIKVGDELAEQEARRAAGGSTRQSRANDLMAESAGLQPSGGQSPTEGRLFGPSGGEIKAAQTAAAEAAEAIKQGNQVTEASARRMLEASARAFAGVTELRMEALAGQKKAVEDDAKVQQQAIEDTRDKDIAASQARLQATIRDLDARQQAAADYFAAEIEGVENARDRDIAAVEARRDATLAGIEAEQQAVATRRTAEDRATEDRREGERRGVEQMTAAYEAFITGEIEGINRVKDEAVRAIDERMEAEDRRHSEALRNLDEEENRQLGIIDDALKGLDAEVERERRADTDRELKHNLSVAKQEVKAADTPAERATARNALTRAQNAIDKEARDRARADARAVLREKADDIRKEFDQRKKAETDKNKLITEGLDKEKTAAEKSADDQIKEQQRWLNDFKEGQSGALQSMSDRYKDEDRQREDNRKREDQAFADRKTAANQSATDEITEIKRAAQQRIDSLRDQATASERYYAKEKQKANDAATAEQTAIKNTAEFHIRALRTQTDATIAYLDRMGKEWESFSTRVQNAIKAALAHIKGYLSGEIKVDFTTTATGSGPRREGESREPNTPGRYRPGTDVGTGYNIIGNNVLWSGGGGQYDPTTGQLGNIFGSPPPGNVPTTKPGRALGGPVIAGRGYMVGEGGRPEYFQPKENGDIVSHQDLLNRDWRQQARANRPAGQAGAAGVTLAVTNNVDGRGVQNVDQLADLVVARSTHAVIGLLDKAERMHAAAVSSDQGRAR